MGFLSRLLGFETKARITVKFYRNDDEASVLIEGTLTEQEWSWVLLLHLSKSLYTMGDPGAPLLIYQLTTYTEEVLVKPPSRYILGEQIPSPLAGELRIVPSRPHTLGFTTEVIQKAGELPVIQTAAPPGSTTGQLALTNFVLFDYLLKQFQPMAGYFLCLKVRLMLKYYEEGSSYRDAASIVGAPVRAASLFAKAIQSIGE